METDSEPWSASSFNGTVSPHLLTIVFKKKWDLFRMMVMAVWGILKLLVG